MAEIPDLDLKLIYAFEALLNHKSVSRAADELDVSQPALSQSLAKLRRLFGDQLFVRTAEGMAPTPCACLLAEPLLEMANIYRSKVQQVRFFDPASSEREFSIATSDIGELLFLPDLLKAVQIKAPKIRLHIHRIEATLLHGLQSGEIDLALGGFPKLEAGIHERRIFQEQYACLVRKDHPKINHYMTKDQFLAASHILVTSHTVGHAHMRAERTLRQLLDPHSIRLITQSFLIGALLLTTTDCVLTVPSQVGIKLADAVGLQIIDPPFEFEPFDVMALWHERFHKDPAHQWLRSLIAEVFGDRVAP